MMVWPDKINGHTDKMCGSLLRLALNLETAYALATIKLQVGWMESIPKTNWGSQNDFGRALTHSTKESITYVIHKITKGTDDLPLKGEFFKRLIDALINILLLL